MMKLLHTRRPGEKNDLTRLIPSVTPNEHLKRVEDWTKKSQPAPPSNKRKSSRQVENEDLERKSRLVSEALRLMDSREAQMQSRSRPETARTPPPGGVAGSTVDNAAENLSTLTPDRPEDFESVFGIGKRFRESRMNARAYVKDFEKKMKKKNDLAAAVLNVYPVGKARKNFRTKMMTHMIQGTYPLVGMEPETWRQKMSRSVRFSVKAPSVVRTIPSSMNGIADGDGTGIEQRSEAEVSQKLMMKQENDRDWWKWKLKQRFMQNDELLQKLASQRQKLESALNIGGMRKKRLSLQSSSTSSLTTLPLLTRNESSRHIMLEIAPSKPGPILKQKENKNEVLELPSKLKDPMPNFYAPSKQFLNKYKMSGAGEKRSSLTVTTKQKLKTLKKDPYLSKLLTGNEQFKPEMMLDASQSTRKNEISPQFKEHSRASVPNNNNARRKLSLESFSDTTDDEFTATKFFNPDVKVLYERMSEVDTTNPKQENPKNKSSREPSDGFLNLPLLLATGRFNRYNKLPQVKGFDEYTSSKPRRSEKNYRNRSQSPANKRRFSSVPPKVGVMAAAANQASGGKEDPKNALGGAKTIEEMSTKDWARKLMEKMKPQTATPGNRTDTDESFVTLSDDDDDDDKPPRKDNMIDTRLMNIYDFPEKDKDPKKKNAGPTEQETNTLYHEILMSKWKKEKHEKNKDLVTQGGGNSTKATKTSWKRGSGKKRIDNLNDTLLDNNKPRGMDIWLENIRAKAKKDRFIAPQPNFEASGIPDKSAASSQPVVTTFNNTKAFEVVD